MRPRLPLALVFLGEGGQIVGVFQQQFQTLAGLELRKLGGQGFDTGWKRVWGHCRRR